MKIAFRTLDMYNDGDDDRDKIRANIKEAAEQMMQNEEEVLRERMRTSRGDQLINMTNDVGLFQSKFLSQLPLDCLLVLPAVCTALRDATTGTEEWPKIVATAMARIRTPLAISSGKNTASRALETMKKKHDERVRKYFGVTCRWWITHPIVFASDRRLTGLDELKHLGSVAKLRAGEYRELRDTLAQLFQMWRQQRRYSEFSLDEARKRHNTVVALRASVGRVLEFHDSNRITTGLVRVIPARDTKAFKDWLDFARDAPLDAP